MRGGNFDGDTLYVDFLAHNVFAQPPPTIAPRCHMGWPKLCWPLQALRQTDPAYLTRRLARDKRLELEAIQIFGHAERPGIALRDVGKPLVSLA